MYQTTTIIGHLGRDPEMRYMPSGDPVTSFSVACDRQWNDKSGAKMKETTWFRVSVFGKQAENCNQYLTKGSKVLVEGRLGIDAKTGGPKTFTRQDGTVSSAFELIANITRFLSSKEETSSSASTDDDKTKATTPNDRTNDDIPF